jgi:hypothetical protein
LGQAVVAGAVLNCKFGTAPAALIVVPEGSVVTAGGSPMATVMDFVPIVNIPNFAVCRSPSNRACNNPSRSAPCTPAIAEPWLPGAPTVLVNEIPALTQDSVCGCTLGAPACISIVEPGPSNVQLPG